MTTQRWEKARLKHVAPVRVERLDAKPTEAVYVALENIESWSGKLLLDAPIETVEGGVARFESGDVLFGKLRPYLAKVGRPNFNGVCSTELVVLRPQRVLPKFLQYYLLTPQFIAEVNSWTFGTKMPRVSPDRVMNAELHVPPVEVQRAIVRFLDEQVPRIDAIIEKNRRLLELSQERVKSVFAMTIPSKGQELALRRCVRRFVDYRGATPSKSSAGIPLITAKNVRHGRIDFTDSQEYVLQSTYDEWMQRGFPVTGDVLITTEAPLGEVAQIENLPVALAQRVILLQPDDRVLPAYLKLYLLSPRARYDLKSRATGTTAIGIKASHLKGLPVITPSIEEQREIVSVVERALNDHEQIKRLVSEVIRKLLEYRSALITAAVTGQIDVGSAA